MFDLYPGSSRREPIEVCTDGPDSWFYTWVLGVLLPLGLLIYGIAVIVMQQGWLPVASRAVRPRLELHGVNAIALGIASIAGALLLHLQFFWERFYADVWPITLGKIVGLLALIGGVGFLLFRVGVLGSK